MREQEREVTGVAGVQELQNKTIRLQFFVPEGHMIVARRFIAGSVIKRPASPEGRPNTLSCAKAEGPPSLN